MKTYRIIVPILVGTSMIAAAPAIASEGSQVRTVAMQTGKAEAKKDEKLICKKFKRTESRLKTVEACATAETWKKIENGEYVPQA